MKLQRLAIYITFAFMIAMTVLLARWKAANEADNVQTTIQITALQTVQALASQHMQTLLAEQLAVQARSINIHDNSNQIIAELLAVQSMKLSPTIDAAQVLQSNLSAKLISSVKLKNPISSAAFSADGIYLVTGGPNPTIQIWEISTGREVLQIHQENDVQSVVFSPDDRQVASIGTDFTIRIWDADNGKEVAHMTHMGPQLSIVYSSDSKYILSSSSDRTARVWDAANGNEIASFFHGDSVTAIAFSPDNQHVATGSLDQTARIWNIFSAQEVARITHYKAITSITFSPDGKYVLSGDEGSRAHLWKVPTSPLEGNTFQTEDAAVAEVPELECPAAVTAVAISPDGNSLALGCQQSLPIASYSYLKEALTIRMWRRESYGWRKIYDSKISLKSTVTSLLFSSDGQYLLSSSKDHTARVWDLTHGQETSRMTHNAAISAIAFSPDGKLVLSGSVDQTVHVWETIPWREALHGSNSGSITTMALSADGKYIASGGRDSAILVQEMETGLEIVHLKLESPKLSTEENILSFNHNIGMTTHNNEINSIAFSPDGKYLVSGSSDNTVRIWDAGNGQEISKLTPDFKVIETSDGRKLYLGGIYSVVFSPDGKYVASGGPDGNIYTWDVESGQEIARLAPVLKNDMSLYTYYDVLAMAFSADGKYLVSGSMDNTVRIWELETGQEIARPSLSGAENFSPPGAPSVAFSPNGRYVVWGGGNIVHVWDMVKKQEVLRMKHDHITYSSVDGRYALEDDGRSSFGKVTSVVFSQDGKYILSAGGDNTARIWDASNGHEISRIVHFTYSYSSDYVRSAAFSTDGKYVVSLDSLGQINLSLWRTDDLIADACSRLPRNLTRSEWAQYIGDMMPYQAVCGFLKVDS